MIAAIMQPYFFPYLGYFQLMAAVDHFVFYDDAQFMKGGWVNRNRVLLNGSPQWWTYAVQRDDYRLPINERYYEGGTEPVRRLFAQLDAAYRKAPNHEEVRAWLGELWLHGDNNVAAFNQRSLTILAQKLGLSCTWRSSSTMGIHDTHGVDKVLAICNELGVTTYINAAGGRSLYSQERFDSAGLALKFMDEPLPAYTQQPGCPLVPGLSIVDSLMYCGFDGVSRMLLNGLTVSNA